MQKKLYIPTSTLNFNNIISSESISPYSFYNLRGYGFKHFIKVNFNSLDNVILLYENFPIFEIEDEELENYPMVIEVCVDSCRVKLENVKEGVYACTETIYLNPFNTRIFFGSYQELLKTKSKAEPSIEAKLAKLYDGCYSLIDNSIVKKRYSIETIMDVEVNLNALNKDIIINKLKGFLYSYIIASNRSYDSNVVSLKMHVKQLINTLSAIVISPQFIDKDLFNNANLDYLYRLITYDVECIEGISEKVNKIIERKINQYGVSNLVDILREEELYEFWRVKIKNKNNLNIKNVITRFSVSLGSDKLSLLNNYSEYLDILVSNLDKKVDNISLEKLPIISEYKIAEIPDQKDFIVNFLNEFLVDKVQKESFLAHRYDYARRGGALFKNVLADKWEGSEEKIYINALLKNLNEYTAFDINSIANQTLKSYAAFFQKGDVEIEKLEDYLVANGIGDLRLAFALWGVIFGFADMPKTITKDLFDSLDNAYKVAIYKGVYKSIHQINLDGDLQNSKLEEYETSCYAERKSVKSFVSGIKEKCGEIFGFHFDKNNYSEEYPECLCRVFDTTDFKEIKSRAQDWYKDKALNIWKQYQIISPECYDSLLLLRNDCPVYGTKNKWENSLCIIKPSMSKKNKSKSKRQNHSQENNLSFNFEEEESKHFIITLNSVKHFNKEQQKRLISNWEYTQKQTKGDKNNHLKFFVNLCKKEGRGEGNCGHNSVLYEVFTEFVAKEIQDEIKRVYF